jgi:photosystem II stability/assembly factor-like uncharacterized protein
MTLRDDVRDYFDRESRRLPVPAGLRADVTARAIEVPTARRTIRLAAVVAGVLAVAIVAALIASGQLRQVLNPPTTPGGHIQLRSGQIEQLVDADLIDSKHGWVLIAVCDQNGPCKFVVEATLDGGRTWGDPVDTGPHTGGFGADSPRHIHFANANDGFVYGLGIAFVTHDGGRTWNQLAGTASELVAITGSTTVWAVLQQCSGGGQCLFGVMASSDYGRHWSNSSPLPRGFQPSQAIAFGSQGLLLAGPGAGDMAITTDGGRTWRSVPGRCSAGSVGNYVTTLDGLELWQMCNVASTPLVLRLFTSEDSGKTWAESPAVPGNGQLPSLGVQSIALVSTGPGSALFSIGQLPLELTTDGGRSWTAVTSGAYWTLIVFGTPTDGWLVHAGGVIWATHDGGLTWAKLPAQP